MARGYKRLTRKARHIIRHLRRTKHASVQDQMVHELRHEVSRTHGFRGPGKAPDRSKAGNWRPLTRKAKQMLTRLRKAKVWSVQKQIVNELAREMERGRRVADRARQAVLRARARAEAAGRRVRAGAERTVRASRTAGRRTRNGWNHARPHAARAGRKFRATVNRGQERLLARAERQQAGRQKRGPGRIRRSVRSARDNARRRLRSRQQPRRAPSRPRPRPLQYRAPRTPRAPRPPRTRRRPARTR
jgi:hypothetical protein